MSYQETYILGTTLSCVVHNIFILLSVPISEPFVKKKMVWSFPQRKLLCRSWSVKKTISVLLVLHALGF